MKGTPVNRILSSAVKVAGSLAVVGGVMAAAITPAGASRNSPTSAFGVAAYGFADISPVAYADIFNTPQVSGPVVYPGFLTTGGILDRAKPLQAYSQVGSPKVYYGADPVDQLNASLVSSSCRIFGDDASGWATIQAGSIVAPSFPGIPNIPLPRNPAPNTVLNFGPLTVTLNQQVVTGSRLTVTGIAISGFGENLAIAVSRCHVDL
jgi:hypothetical protein